MKKLKADKIFLALLGTLSILGLFIFTSASLGILVESLDQFKTIIIKQITLGLIFGWIALLISSKIDYRNWERLSPYIFLISICVTLFVFVPGIGISIKGAKRWLDLGFTTFQPVEFLKFGFVVFYAHYLSSIKERIKTFKYGVLPSILIVGVPVLTILSQPDTGSSLSLIAAGMAMFLVAGGKKRYFVGLIFLVILMVATMAYLKPYAMERIKVFIDPSLDPQGSGYQLRQSLIAVGSGGVAGRGLGQSIQKFTFLPEAIGDSIFSVAAEEFGFMGSTIVVLLFLCFGLRGLRIASRSPDIFGRLLVTGLIILAVSQSFINIGSMLGIVPMTGVPLLFLSHGGTALLVTLFEMGIILNVSKYQVR